MGLRVNGAAAYLMIAAGSLLGGLSRWSLSQLVGMDAGGTWPLATLLINVTGSGVIGAYAALAGPGGPLQAGPLPGLFITVGFCGGYTTFSIFSLELLRLLQDGRIAEAMLAAGLSVVACMAAVWAGYAMGIRVQRRP